MYLQHFGLAQYPFSLTPNTRYFLKLPSHQHAFDSLIAALDEDGCFSKVIGEVGTGKTMLCRKVLNALEPYQDKYLTAYIPHPILTEEATMHSFAEELGLELDEGARYGEMLKQITSAIVENAKDNKQVVLFIDEAQAIAGSDPLTNPARWRDLSGGLTPKFIVRAAGGGHAGHVSNCREIASWDHSRALPSSKSPASGLGLLPPCCWRT